jgi:cell division protein FtsL
MIRLGTAMWLLLVAASGYAMFQIKYEVVKLEDELTRINRQIVTSRESTRVLSAEWSFLNQPGRLDRLAKRYLSLGPIATAQLGSVDSLPRRSPVPPAAVAVAAPLPASSHPAAASWLASVPSEVPQ